MGLARAAKLGLLRTLHYSGASGVIHRSKWRSQRLLILCYHGISLADEHDWRPSLFISPDVFRVRLQALERHRCSVLPFGEAVERLAASDLPERAVTITFDDGFHNYHAAAAPLLAEFGFPAALYLTTYYVDHQTPIFNLAADYLLWKHRASGRTIGPDLGPPTPMALTSAGAAGQISAAVLRGADTLSAAQKDDRLRQLAGALGEDYEAFCRARLFSLLSPEQIQDLAARPGFAFELHTHRHRTPRAEDLFRREVRENRERVAALSGQAPKHFCYPSGQFDDSFLGWLRAEGVRSATTCELGLARSSDDLLLLPRLLDWRGLTQLEFESWVCGTGQMAHHLAAARSTAGARSHY